MRDVLYAPEPGVEVLVRAQFPDHPRGEVILAHGLEGSSESGYMRSAAAAALEAGYAAHRYNMRGCGASPWHRKANYHSGQTEDLLMIARERKRASGLPVFVAGFSLGGNMALKLAGELGERGREVLAGVCSVSPPIDLAKSVEECARPHNFLYENRFVGKLKDRVRKRHPMAPDLFPLEHLPKVKSIYDFDDYYTARIFGFGGAANYYATQSSHQFLSRIRIPTLVIHSNDDPLIPAGIYAHPAFRENPALTLIETEHGGHLGFLSRHQPRFWLDELIVEWMNQAGVPASRTL